MKTGEFRRGSGTIFETRARRERGSDKDTHAAEQKFDVSVPRGIRLSRGTSGHGERGGGSFNKVAKRLQTEKRASGKYEQVLFNIINRLSPSV